MFNQKRSRLTKVISSCLLMSCLISSSLHAMDVPQNLALLPKEAQIAVVTYKDEETKQRILDYKDILNMQQVCKSWSQITSQGDLWGILAQQDGFETHPNMAFQAHYNYVKGKKLIGDHIVTDREEGLAPPIAQEMINCLNKSAPYMHFGAINLLMNLMNSPHIPLELPCIQVPKDMSLMVYPLMSEKEILKKSDEEILQICSGHEGRIIEKEYALRNKLLQIIKSKNLPFLLDLYDKYMDFYQKMRDQKYSKEIKEEIRFKLRCKLLDSFSANKGSIFKRIDTAIEERDFTSLDLIVRYLCTLLCEFTDSYYCSSSSSSSSESSESEEDLEESVDDPYLPFLNEAHNLLESIKEYIHSHVPFSQTAKMGNYIKCLGTSIVDESDKKPFGPLEDKSVRGYDSSPMYLFHTIFKEEQILLSLLRAGFASPLILDSLQRGLYEWKPIDGFSQNTGNDTSFSDQFLIEKYEAYGQLLFKELAIKHPQLCFVGSNNSLGVDIIYNTTTHGINFSPLKSRHFLTNVHFSKISHGNSINLWAIQFLLTNLNSMDSSIPFLLESDSPHPKIYQKFLGFQSFEEFQRDLSRTHLPKLLALSENQGNLALSSHEKKLIQHTLGLMYFYLGNWGEGKSIFLQLADASPYPYCLYTLPPEKGLEILNILDPNEDRGDNWAQVRSKIEEEKDWKERQRRNEEG